jgi:multidrug resistance efflux pump
MMFKNTLFVVCALSALTLFSCSGAPVFKGRVEAELSEVCTPIGGKLVSTNAAMGQTVKKGDLLAQIDDSDYRFNLAQLEASLLQAQNAEKAAEYAQKSADETAQNAHVQLKRNQPLLSSGSVTLETVDNLSLAATVDDNNASQAAAQVLESQDNIALTQSKIRQCQNNITKTEIRAPCDGVIMGKYYEDGDVAAAGAALYDIAAGKYVLLYVDEADIADLKYGMDVQISAKAPDGKTETVDGEVIFIDASAEYTPREFRTSANLNKKSVRTKLSLPASAPFQLDQEVSVRIKRAVDKALLHKSL